MEPFFIGSQKHSYPHRRLTGKCIYYDTQADMKPAAEGDFTIQKI